MSFITICVIAVVGLLLWIISTISQIKSDITRINLNINKIADQVGVHDMMTNELKNLISDGKKIEAIKKYRIATGLGLKESKEYIDTLSK